MVIFVFWGSASRKDAFFCLDRLGAPSEQDLGHFSAWQAVGIPFRAGKDAFFCLEPPRSTFRAGFGAIFCPAGGWYPVPRRKRCLFLPETASEHHPSRIWGIFLPGRRLVSRSAQEKTPFSAWNRLGTPSEQDLGQFSALNRLGSTIRAKEI